MPFCKLCFDLGRPDFNNHDVRDAARNTTCPYLLSTKCRKCGYFGHTVKYCKMSDKTFPRHAKSNKPKHIEVVKQVVKPSNAFSVLLCTMIADEDKHDTKKENTEYTPFNLNDLFGKSTKSWADQVEEEEAQLALQVS